MAADSKTIAFVLGGAESVWADLASARLLCTPTTTIVVNDMGVDFSGPIDYWVSYHSDRLGRWSQMRAARGLEPPKEYWTGKGGPSRAAPKNTKMIGTMGGSSGMLATFVALHTGAAKVILCGIPIDPEMRHYHEHQRGKAWTEASKYQKHWQDAVPAFRNRVRSMSGWTAALLGLPTPEWLEG